MRYLPPTVCLADLPAHHAQHIRQSPRRQLGCFYGYGYRAPGNIFINQLHRLLPWDNLDVLTKWLTKVKCSGIVYLARAPYNERSKRMNTIQELQKLREELIREIDEKFDWIIDEVKKESVPSRQKESRKPRNYEIIYPLNVGAGIFKGKRPTGVIFADGRRTENPTWKSVAEELLKDCCKDSDQRQALMDLRGKVLGRNRVLLGSETGKMRSPVKIDEALYIETHYDAETLMRILTTRILDMVGYDYSKIRIAVKAE